MMEHCSWCKNERATVGFSNHKEPLCVECLEKYRFGVSKKMITGSVLRLSREDRRRISDKNQTLISLRRGVYGIGREVLMGRLKILSHAIGFVLIVLFFLLSYQYKFPEWQILHTPAGWPITLLFYLVVPPVLFAMSAVPFLILYRVFVWGLKYWQLTSRSS